MSFSLKRINILLKIFLTTILFFFSFSTKKNILSMKNEIQNQYLQFTKKIESNINKNLFSIKKYITYDLYLIKKNNELKYQIENLEKVLVKIELLKKENKELKKINYFVKNKNFSYITSKIFFKNKNNFLHSAIVTSNEKIKENQIVINSDKALVGKIHLVTKDFANVLPLIDPRFRIEAITQKGNLPCIIAGKGNTSELNILHLDKNYISEGELLFSTQDETNNIPGIPICVVTSVKDDIILAKPISNFNNNQLVTIITN